MIDITSTQSFIDIAIDRFERDWTVQSIELIEAMLPVSRLGNRQVVAAELVRVDIDKRYAVGCDIRLSDYFDRFPELLRSQDHSQAIAYEDFRARFSRGLPCEPDRWSFIPGIESRSWFVEALNLSSGKQIQSERIAALSTDIKENRIERSPLLAKALEFPKIGELLNDFELLALLGTGALSQVYLARQLSLAGRYVAVKVVTRPLHEPAHLARLQHTGIVPLYSFHRAEPWWLLCMPYNGSATLADWLKSESAPGSRTGESLVATIRTAQDRITQVDLPEESEPEQSSTRDGRAWLRSWNSANARPLEELRCLSAEKFAIWFFRRIAAALAHAHQRGIVHGDLKPANILIRSDGEPALIDFNLSQSIDSETDAWLGGTLPYMAPEQLEAFLCRSPSEARTTTDVYALGTIVYEMVEGGLPFPVPTSASGTDLVVAIENRRHVKPVFAARGRRGLAAIVSKCLAFDPKQRYQSALELLEDVERECENKRLRHCRESLWCSRVPKFAARHPKAFSAGSVAILSVVLLGLITSALLGYRERAQRLSAVETLDRFKLASDSALAGFLAADDARDDQQAARVQSALAIYGLDVPDQAQSWHQTSDIVQLNANERRSLSQRFLAMAFLACLDNAHGISDGENSPQRSDVRKNTLALLAGVRLIHPDSTSVSRFLESGDLGALESLKHAGDPFERLLFSCGLVSSRRLDEAHQLLSNLSVTESLQKAVYWMTLGRAQMGQRNLRESIVAFSLAIHETPQASTGYFNRGLAKFQLRDYLGAHVDFSSAIQRDPRSIPALANRYFASSALGEHESALKDLDQILQISPTSNRALIMRSRTLKQLGRLDESEAAFQRALQSPPRDAADWVSLALARLPGEPAKALDDLKQAELKHGPDAKVLQAMAHVYSEQLDDIPKAVETLDRLLTRRPLFSNALGGRAVLHARLGNIQRSLDDIRSLEGKPAALSAEAQYQVACAYAICSAKRPELISYALRHLAKAVKRDYGGELMTTDKDLDALKDHRAFRTILENWQLTKK